MSTEELLKMWLDKTVAWQENSASLKTLLDQAKSCAELTIFLKGLKKELEGKGSVDRVFKELPLVGQLLGRLTTIKVVMCHPESYQSLMECILFFHVDNPTTPLEVRAQTWVVSQIRSAVCSPDISDVNILMKMSGVTQQQIHVETVEQLICDIVNSAAPEKPCKINMETMLDAISLCLHLYAIPDMMTMLEKIIVSASVNDVSGTEEIFQLLTESQKHAYGSGTNGTTLSYAVQKLLLTSYLPSLEQEVLLLVNACSSLPVCSVLQIERLVQSRHLIAICAEVLSIYETVFSILKTLYWDTDGCFSISTLIGVLHGGIRQHCNSQQQKRVISLRCAGPSQIQPVIAVMDVNPSRLSQTTLEYKMKDLQEKLSSLQIDPEYADAVHFCLLQHQVWALAAMMLALCGSKQTLLLGVVRALRVLLMKSTLQWEEIQCVLADLPKDFSNNHQSLLGTLLVVFASHSVSGVELVPRILQEICHCVAPANQLERLLEILSQVATFWQDNLKLSPLRIERLFDVLIHMEESLTESTNNKSDPVHGETDSDKLMTFKSASNELRTMLSQTLKGALHL